MTVLQNMPQSISWDKETSANFMGERDLSQFHRRRRQIIITRRRNRTQIIHLPLCSTEYLSCFLMKSGKGQFSMCSIIDCNRLLIRYKLLLICYSRLLICSKALPIYYNRLLICNHRLLIWQTTITNNFTCQLTALKMNRIMAPIRLNKQIQDSTGDKTVGCGYGV